MSESDLYESEQVLLTNLILPEVGVVSPTLIQVFTTVHFILKRGFQETSFSKELESSLISKVERAAFWELAGIWLSSTVTADEDLLTDQKAGKAGGGSGFSSSKRS